MLGGYCAGERKEFEMDHTSKVIVAGTRTFEDYRFAEERLDYLLSNFFREGRPIEIVSGGAAGADRIGEMYAKKRNLRLKVFKADWDKYGKAAGPIRNKEMAEYAEQCVVFWDGRSTGTLNMINEAKLHGIDSRIIYYGKRHAKDEK